jgi:hypothetical protein
MRVPEPGGEEDSSGYALGSLTRHVSVGLVPCSPSQVLTFADTQGLLGDMQVGTSISGHFVREPSARRDPRAVLMSLFSPQRAAAALGLSARAIMCVPATGTGLQWLLRRD